MRIPDILAIHLTRGDKHSQFLHMLGQGRLVAQVIGEMKRSTCGFGAVDHHRERAGARHTSTALHHGIEGVLKIVGDVLTRCCRYSRHAAIPYIRWLLKRHRSNSLPQRHYCVICVGQFWFDSRSAYTTMGQESVDNSPTEVMA